MQFADCYSPVGLATILEVDAPQVLARQLGLNLEVEGNHQVLQRVIQALRKIIGDHVTAVALEPNLTFPLWQDHSPQTPLLLRIDQNGLEPNLGLPSLYSSWGVEEVANNYALVKLELWYHPGETLATEKKQLLAELYDYCEQQKTSLVVKLHLIPPPGAPEVLQLQEAHIVALQELRATAHGFILDYPGSPLAAATISAELDIPWLLNVQATSYDEAKAQLRTALENGAQGGVIGYQLWQEIGSFMRPETGLNWDKLLEYFSTVVRDRLIEVRRVVDETEPVA